MMATAVFGTDSATSAGISQINPVAKLGAALLLGLMLLTTIDWVSAAVALGLEALVFPWAGLSLKRFFLRTIPIWVAAPAAGLTTLLYGRDSGAMLWQFWFVSATQGSAELALATLLRILAIGLPAVVLFVTIDPTDLADGLGQVLRLPARFVLGGLAGLRLLGLFAEDWRSLSLARRARGVADRGTLRRLAGQAFVLLVLSIRRGSKLATAMEARGFGSNRPRTWARVSRFGLIEWGLIALGGAIAAVALAVSVMSGSWNFVLG